MKGYRVSSGGSIGWCYECGAIEKRQVFEQDRHVCQSMNLTDSEVSLVKEQP